MKTNPLKDGALIENSGGLGTVTRKMVRERAVQLALLDGRLPQEASKADWDQAWCELTGKPETDPNQTQLESAPESERWDPLPGSAGHQTAVPVGEDEDAEGRSDNERLVEEGISEAVHDQMQQAAEAAIKKDP